MAADFYSSVFGNNWQQTRGQPQQMGMQPRQAGHGRQMQALPQNQWFNPGAVGAPPTPPMGVAGNANLSSTPGFMGPAGNRASFGGLNQWGLPGGQTPWNMPRGGAAWNPQTGQLGAGGMSPGAAGLSQQFMANLTGMNRPAHSAPADMWSQGAAGLKNAFSFGATQEQNALSAQLQANLTGMTGPATSTWNPQTSQLGWTSMPAGSAAWGSAQPQGEAADMARRYAAYQARLQNDYARLRGTRP